MRRKQTQNFIVGGALISALLITVTTVFAYDQEFTHPALTDEIVDFYNLNYSPKLNENDKRLLIKGSIDEDQGIRPMAHFYDPVYNRGMAGFPTSKQWAMGSGAQSNLALANKSIAESAGFIKSADDFSYQRAMADYAVGDRQRALVGFGHLLHLLEDAGVPDHTRNDPHPPVGVLGSPYEHEMAKWNPGNFNIASELKNKGLKPVILSNLGEYFDKIAKYSNGNFFSKDTIFSNEYSNPSVDSWQYRKNAQEEELLGYKKDSAGGYVLVKTIIRTGKSTITDTDILDEYWNRLSKEVVVNGAGALNLLLTEAEEAKVEYAKNPPQTPSLFSRILGLMGITVGKQVVDKSNNSDTEVTQTPKVTNPPVSPKPVVTKTPDTNVTKVSPTPSPSKTPKPTPKLTPKPTPKPSATPKLSPTPKPSPTPKLSVAKTSGKVVINEIAWAGTSASATDEWIELYNTETYSIDISSWQLVSGDESPDIILPEGTIIAANAYFLIERTDDNTVGNVTADLATSFGQGGLNNGGEMVRLFDSAGNVVDMVGSTGEAWYFGDSTSKNSMERIDPAKAGNNASNWKSFSGTSVNKNATDGPVNGTPKAKNSTAIQVVISSGGGSGGGGGSSSTPTSTATPTPTPTPTPTSTPSPSPTPTPSPTLEPEGDTANLGDVVINEIAWMGTAASTSDNEWLELYNTTDQPINMNGWTLKSQDETPNITLSGIVPASGYYLLERTDDDTLPDITADQIYTGALGNSGEHLVLKDTAGTTISEVDGSNGWKINGDDVQIGDNNTKKTAQKMASEWITATATPKAENQADISENSQNPSAIADFAASYNSPMISATWTASDSGGYSQASLSYDLRYSPLNFTDENAWNNATKVASSSLPDVGAEGAPQSASFDVIPQYGQALYFALKIINVTTSEVVSPQSNVATVNFPVAIDTNAWSMWGGNPHHTGYFSTLSGPAAGATKSWEFDAGDGKNVSQPVVSVDGDIFFGAVDGSSGNLIKLDKNGTKQWEYSINVSISTPAVLSDESVYFGRVGAGGANTFTALNPDGLKRWDFGGPGSVNKVTVSAEGNAYFTSNANPNSRLHVLNSSGNLVMEKIDAGFYDLSPVVLDNGTIIAAKYLSGHQFFYAYSADGTELWNLSYTGAYSNSPSNPSHDQSTGKTYSAAGPKLLEINPAGSAITPTTIAAWDDSAATVVAITPDTLYVGFNNNTNPASGSQLIALEKSNPGTQKWSFPVDGLFNQQIAVDKDSNAYFSTKSGHLYSVDPTGHERWHISVDIGSNTSVISPVLTENGIVWGYLNKIILVK